jgi:hypothetical protein
MHHRALWLLAVPLLMGSRCRELTDDLDFRDKAALEVFLLHTPDVGAAYGLDLEQGEVTMMEVFLYKPLDTGGDTQVGGALVRAVMPDGTPVVLDEVEPGHYRALSTDKPNLYFLERGSYEVVASHEGETWSASALAFVATEITAPEDGAQVEQGAPLTIQTASPAEAMVAMVFDQEGQQVYDTLPSSAEDLLALVDGEGVQEITIEGQALDQAGVYLVGVAGVEKADWREHSDNLYPNLSVFASGSLDSLAVTTAPLAGMAGMVMAMQGDDLLEYGIDLPDRVEAMLYGAQLSLEAGLEEQPIRGASAELRWGANTVALPESPETDGLYQATTDDNHALAYQQGQEYALVLDDGEEQYRLAMTAPAPPSLPSPAPMSYHDPDTQLILTCPGDRDMCFAALLDRDGEPIWDDLPEVDSVDALLDGDLGTPGGEEIHIAAGHFSAQGQLYAVGLLGMKRMGGDGWSDSLNPEMVDMAIGTTAFTVVTTVQAP